MTESWVTGAILGLIESQADCTEKLLALQVITPQIPQSAKPRKG
jgi:hypothetical protein